MTPLERADIEPVVRRALNAPAAVLLAFSVEELAGGDGQDLGVVRAAGDALVGTATVHWTVIGKRLAPVSAANAPHAWSHPRREASAYASGLLGDLPEGLSAPRCLGTSEGEDGALVLWLDEVANAASRWTLADYARVAHDLGRFNGAYLAGRPLPRQPWLSRHWLHSWLAEGADAVAALDADRSHPLVDRVFPAAVAGSLTRLWERRAAQLAALDRLPHTFCHNDAFRRNLFTSATWTVAVDWAFAGSGPLGAELAPLVWGSLGFLEAEWHERRALERGVLDAYADGLRAAGARVSTDDIHRGYATTAALRYGAGVVRLMVPVLRDEALQHGPERVLGIPFGDVVEHWAALIREVLALGEPGRRPLRQAPRRSPVSTDSHPSTEAEPRP